MSDNKTINTMIELTKTNRITTGVIAVLVVLLLGFLFLKPVSFSFNTPLEQELSEVNQTQYKVSPQQIAQSITKKDPQTVLIDVRSPFEFNKGHLPEAINIYSVNLLDNNTVSFFKDLAKGNKKVILYGASASEANVPFMILKQMGIQNIAISNAGYDVFKNNNWAEIAAQTTTFDDEIPVIDFAQFISDANKSNAPTEMKKPDAEKLKVVKEQQKVAPKPVESAGDEGC